MLVPQVVEGKPGWLRVEVRLPDAPGDSDVELSTGS